MKTKVAAICKCAYPVDDFSSHIIGNFFPNQPVKNHLFRVMRTIRRRTVKSWTRLLANLRRRCSSGRRCLIRGQGR